MKSIILVESIQEATPKARAELNVQSKPATVVGRLRATTEGGDKVSDFMRLTTMENLYAYWLKAKKNKSKSARIQQFGEDPLRYLLLIQKRLRDREYKFGPYKYFRIKEKKHRDVVDSPMKDRIVHWMLYDYLLNIWEKRFIHDTYGNLPGRGTHAAVRRLARFCRKEGSDWVFQMDLSKYFYSVNHALLKDKITRYVGDFDIRRLLYDLVDSFYTDNRYDDLFACDSLYRKTLAKGMPIGNLSSQLFANIFLNEFDHWVKEVLMVKQYIRYVDDIVIVGSSLEELRWFQQMIFAKLAADGLIAHPKKSRFAPVRTGIPFLGYVVWPSHISAGRYIRSRYHKSLRAHEAGCIDCSASVSAYRAMLRHTGRAKTIVAPTQ